MLQMNLRKRKLDSELQKEIDNTTQHAEQIYRMIGWMWAVGTQLFKESNDKIRKVNTTKRHGKGGCSSYDGQYIGASGRSLNKTRGNKI